MIYKEELLTMIDHCLYYSGESYASDFYKRYRDVVERSVLDEEEKAACVRVLDNLVKTSVKHLETLRNLKGTIERDGKNLY